MRGLEREYAGQVDFTFVNVLLPQNAAYIETYGFSATPELYLLDASGQVAGFWDEIASADDLRPAFDELLGR